MGVECADDVFHKYSGVIFPIFMRDAPFVSALIGWNNEDGILRLSYVLSYATLAFHIESKIYASIGIKAAKSRQCYFFK